MAEQEIYPHGTFCWNELSTSNADACKNFYTNLLGWTARDEEFGGTNYTMFKAGERTVGGMMQMNAEWGNVPSHWMAYIAVEDVDAIVNQVEALGGKVCVPPTDIPTVGRFCVITDPSGATVSLIKLSAA